MMNTTTNSAIGTEETVKCDEIAFDIFCLDPNSPNYIGNNHFPNP